WAELAAPATFGVAVRLYCSLNLASRHRPIHNLVISNVPGPRFPLYFAGAEVKAIYPIGPVLEGAGLNVTVMSYRDSVDFSLIVDKSLMPDVWDLARFIDASFAELYLAAVGRPYGQAPEPPQDDAPAEPPAPKKRLAARPTRT